ncbi:hypothetical protein C7M84_004954 [Penaeus vannamei]|uniref:Uncharacterized protein n=1 Tax=Penaeus vannamei TaxID=6689 RepID=A0A423TJ35_PENVA|nr:hypothetical protein C7M84_004954 [Penaeus vannamei]
MTPASPPPPPVASLTLPPVADVAGGSGGAGLPPGRARGRRGEPRRPGEAHVGGGPGGGGRQGRLLRQPRLRVRGHRRPVVHAAAAAARGGGGGGGEKTAERRTLDLLYHWFLSDPKKPSRPSLIEEVFRTIDNHIIEDLREWNANAFPHLPKTPGHGAAHDHGARATKGAPAAQEDTLLVTDEQGANTWSPSTTSSCWAARARRQEVLRGAAVAARAAPGHQPRAGARAQAHAGLRPAGEAAAARPPARPGGLAGELARPVRHTGPAKGAPAGPPKAAAALLAEQGDDVFVVQDEQGGVQVVTLQDILASLSALDSGSVNQLLFGEGLGVAPQLPLPSAAGHDAAAAAAVPPAAAHPNAASKKPGPRTPLRPRRAQHHRPRRAGRAGGAGGAGRRREERPQQEHPQPPGGQPGQGRRGAAQPRPGAPPAAPLTPQQEYIQLVLRQQKRHAAENVFGDVLLSKLPSESLRKLLLQALQKKSTASAPDPPAVRAPRIPDKPQDRSSYAELPDYSSLGGGYGGGEGYGGGDENPLFDVYFLADATSLYKIGDTNLSLKTPKIGSPKNFPIMRMIQHHLRSSRTLSFTAFSECGTMEGRS